jgi:hypothetical protein
MKVELYKIVSVTEASACNERQFIALTLIFDLQLNCRELKKKKQKKTI